jgi:hypothetical protein
MLACEMSPRTHEEIAPLPIALGITKASNARNRAHHENILSQVRGSLVFQAEVFRGDESQFDASAIPVQEAFNSFAFFTSSLILPEISHIGLGCGAEYAEYGPALVRVPGLVIAV